MPHFSDFQPSDLPILKQLQADSARLNDTFYAKIQGDILEDEVVDEISKDVKHDLLESD